MSILAVNAGAAFHLESLEGPRYRHFFDRLIRPEELGDVNLDAYGALLVPCRTAAHRLMPHVGELRSYLDAGGTIVAMGECHSERWLPNICFTPVETNFWWWLTGDDLGVRSRQPRHPLWEHLGRRAVTWHYHGLLTPPPGAEALVVVEEDGRDAGVLLYDDRVSTAGRILATTLDPTYHHGSNFMPGATQFLYGLLDWLSGIRVMDEAAR